MKTIIHLVLVIATIISSAKGQSLKLRDFDAVDSNGSRVPEHDLSGNWIYKELGDKYILEFHRLGNIYVARVDKNKTKLPFKKNEVSMVITAVGSNIYQFAERNKLNDNTESVKNLNVEFDGSELRYIDQDLSMVRVTKTRRNSKSIADTKGNLLAEITNSKSIVQSRPRQPPIIYQKSVSTGLSQTNISTPSRAQNMQPTKRSVVQSIKDSGLPSKNNQKKGRGFNTVMKAIGNTALNIVGFNIGKGKISMESFGKQMAGSLLNRPVQSSQDTVNSMSNQPNPPRSETNPSFSSVMQDLVSKKIDSNTKNYGPILQKLGIKTQ